MKIEKIIMKNYRQYRNLELTFSSEKLCLIKGIMGTGKTNFLNGINWCLYQQEPYLSQDSKALPLLNLRARDETDDGDVSDVIIEMWIKTDDGRPFVITRKAQFLIVGEEKKKPTPYKTTEFEVKIRDESGNYKILKEEDAESQVSRFVPNEVRDFFFFDGERLDRYFKEATGQNIRHAIFQISQTSILKKIEGNLRKIKNDYNREAGKHSPNIEFVRTQLEDAERIKNEKMDMIEKCKEQINIAKEKIIEYNENVKDIPDVEELTKDREELRTKRKENENYLKNKNNEKQELLFEYSIIIYLYPAIKNSLDIIKDKREKKELPPTGDKALLQTIFDNKICTICGRQFNEGSESERIVKKLLDGLKLSTEAAISIQNMESPLITFNDKFHEFKDKLIKISNEIEKIEKDIYEIDQKLHGIDVKVSGYNEDKIREWYSELRNFENILQTNNQSLGIHKLSLQEAIKNYDELKQRLEDELIRDKKVGKLKNYIDFLSTATDILEKTREEVMEKIREKISSETQKNFFDLMWKKESFEKVSIGEDYDIKVYTFGYEVSPQNISGGERECLALSFTKALHSISGFDAPILIDRPLAMVSGTPRQHIANILLKLSKEKQLILFLTPNDYDDVRNLLNTQSCIIHELKMSSDEKEVKTEVV